MFLTTDIPSLNGPFALATTVHDALVGFIRNSAPAGPRTRRTPHVQTLGGDCVAPKTREG